MIYQMSAKEIPNRHATGVTLADYIQGVMRAKELTLRDVSQRSRGVVSVPTVNDIRNGRTTNPTVATLKGLARGLGVPENEIFDVARGEASTEQPKSSLNSLSEKLQMLILDVYAGITPDEAKRFKLIAEQAGTQRANELAAFDAAKSKTRKTS